MTGLTFEEAMNFVYRNIYRFSVAQRSKMISECYPGFVALMQYERELQYMTDLKHKLDFIHNALDGSLNPDPTKRIYGILTVVFPFNTPGTSYFNCNSPDRQGVANMLREIADNIEKGDPDAK